MKLYFKDLPCWKNVKNNNSRTYCPNWAFDLKRLPNESLRELFEKFILYRAHNISAGSLREEQSQFNKMADFLTQNYANIGSLLEIEEEELHKQADLWLLKTGRRRIYEKSRLDRCKKCIITNPIHGYISRAYEFFMPPKSGFNKDLDIWQTNEMPIRLRESPIRNILTLNFSEIKQDEIKREVKEYILLTLSQHSLATARAELTAVKQLSWFLKSKYPEIQSLNHFKRIHWEEYLAFLLDSNRKKDYRTELSHLKTVVVTVGKMFSYENGNVFLESDFPSRKNVIYKCYSDSELKRFHDSYKYLDKQTARLMIIHELLGLRINETLTLKKKDVLLGDRPRVRIWQEKTGRAYEKGINSDIVILLLQSIKETSDKYGEQEYVFVDDKNPKHPMKYSTLAYRLRKLILQHNLCDDTGDLFTVGTHIFRHTYGKKLCDLFTDDMTISRLLGHSSNSTVSNYRRMSTTVLTQSTKEVINNRNEKIKMFKGGWMNEELFTNDQDE